jgi:uncharacterized protein
MGILTREQQESVREQRLGFVATVGPDGSPNLSPKGTLTVWDDDTLVFAHLYSEQTVANIRVNPVVEINVVDVFTRKGYRFKGTATVLTGGPVFDDVMAMFNAEVEDDRLRDAEKRVKAFVLVRVDRALPLVSPGYDDGTTEEEMVEQWERYWNRVNERRRSAVTG